MLITTDSDTNFVKMNNERDYFNIHISCQIKRFKYSPTWEMLFWLHRLNLPIISKKIVVVSEVYLSFLDLGRYLILLSTFNSSNYFEITLFESAVK